MDALRNRLSETIENLRHNEHLAVDEVLRRGWRNKRIAANAEFPRKPLTRRKFVRLLIETRPDELRMEDISALSDHLTVRPLAEVDGRRAAEVMFNPYAFPLPPKLSLLEKVFGAAKDRAMRFTRWFAVAAPVAREVHRYDHIIRLLTKLLNTLAGPDYDDIEGAGNGGADGETRLLLMAPALTACTEFWPDSFPPDGPGCRLAVEKKVIVMFDRLSAQQPLSECIVLRVAALGILVGLRQTEEFLKQAQAVARERSERQLADIFTMFLRRPSLLDAVADMGCPERCEGAKSPEREVA